MVVLSETHYNDLSDRLDAEYFRPEYLEIENVFNRLIKNKITVEPLAKFCEIVGSAFYGSIRFDYADKGVPFIRVADIQEMSIDKHDLTYLPDNFSKYEKQISEISNNWIVVSKSGATYGGVGIVPEEIKKCKLSRDVLGVKPTDDTSVEYLATFLKSKFGQLQFKRFRSLQAQPHLEIKKVNEVSVVKLESKKQLEIATAVKEGLALLKEANSLYEKSKQELSKSIPINLQTPKKTKYQIRFHELSETSTWSAENHFQEYVQMVETLSQSFKLLKFSEFFSISTETIEQEINPSKDYNYIELGNVTSFGNIDGYTIIKGHQLPSRAKMKLTKGSILIPYLSGSYDKIGVVTDDYDGFIGSTGFFVVKPKYYDCWFSLILLKSPIFQNQLKQRTSGTIMSSITEEAIKKTTLPVFPSELVEDISVNMKKAFYSKKEGLSKVSYAVSSLENAINSATEGEAIDLEVH